MLYIPGKTPYEQEDAIYRLAIAMYDEVRYNDLLTDQEREWAFRGTKVLTEAQINRLRNEYPEWYDFQKWH